VRSVTKPNHASKELDFSLLNSDDGGYLHQEIEGNNVLEVVDLSIATPQF